MLSLGCKVFQSSTYLSLHQHHLFAFAIIFLWVHAFLLLFVFLLFLQLLHVCIIDLPLPITELLASNDRGTNIRWCSTERKQMWPKHILWSHQGIQYLISSSREAASWRRFSLADSILQGNYEWLHWNFWVYVNLSIYSLKLFLMHFIIKSKYFNHCTKYWLCLSYLPSLDYWESERLDYWS